MKNIITIGLPSKGRLKDKLIDYLKERGLKILRGFKERNYFAKIENKPNFSIIFLHAKEIIQRLGDGTLDVGISGLDLLKESEVNIQKNIKIEKRLNFGYATLILACRNEFIDLFTTLDLDEVAEDYKKKNKSLLKIGTKYPNLTREFLYSRGVTNFTLFKSLGSTELMCAMNTAQLISDITSTGTTLKQNNLRILNDGEILKSQACIFSSRKNLKKKGLKKLINLLIK